MCSKDELDGLMGLSHGNSCHVINSAQRLIVFWLKIMVVSDVTPVASKSTCESHMEYKSLVVSRWWIYTTYMGFLILIVQQLEQLSTTVNTLTWVSN